jgi:pimeloyl-ACP methyl ester carboxylesterase
MENLRTYGKAPFTVALLHGGPGAPGTMAPVARELASGRGILEPLQTAASLDGQVRELRAVLEAHADLPVTLLGSSWGAMLGFIFAALHPALVKKLILVGSGVYEEQYAPHIEETRLGRLSEEERREAFFLMEALNDPAGEERSAALARLGELFTKADAYDPLTLDTEGLEAQYRVFQGVWRDAAALRGSGGLTALGRQIQCPVVAIHGDYDPHPPEGVREPLSAVVKDFRFILLARCGHLPWIERQARDEFYRIVREQLGDRG